MKEVRKIVIHLSRATHASPEFYLKMTLGELNEWIEEVVDEFGSQ